MHLQIATHYLHHLKLVVKITKTN